MGLGPFGDGNLLSRSQLGRAIRTGDQALLSHYRQDVGIERIEVFFEETNSVQDGQLKINFPSCSPR